MLIAIIPAYNEERFIGSVVLKAKKYVDAVLVIDDGSKDLTAEVARAAGAVVVRHETNRGKGAALNSGFEKARELRAQAAVVLDGDGQHRPEDIPTVIAPIHDEKADIVVGSRYLEQQSHIPFVRILGHRFFNSFTNWLTGTHVTDSQSGFRAFSTKALQRIKFKSEDFSVESEMQFLAAQQDLQLTEVPIVICYPERPKRSVIAHGVSVLNGILRLVGQHRPLLFFGVPGAILITMGLLWGAWVVDIYSRYQTLAIGYALISVFLSIVGMFFLLTGIILHSIRALLMELKSAMAK
ncbi:MAG: glycosyltransferase family 2 protein [Anaerolineales bacterium]|nr:glycosyltransferase family 2 protein [Anaerolineales bacterium]